MALCKPFMCLFGTSHVQRVITVHVNTVICSRNYCRLLNRKIPLKTEVIRSIKTKCRTPRSSIIKDGVAPKNVGIMPGQLENKEFTMAMLWKPFIFTMSFSAGAFASCVIWQYENVRKQTMSFMKSSNLWHRDGSLWSTNKRISWRDELNKMWNKLSEGEKLFASICFVNVLVHLGWKVPRFQSTMLKYFASNPSSSALCWPMVLSTFSHYSTVHLVLNMCALNSFSTIAVNALGKEQFMCLYLAGGVISSFGSLFFRVLRNRPELSVGASGAILAVIGYIASKYPDLELSIIGLPMCTFTAGTAVMALVAFDFSGLLLGWKLLDHAAHLGGVGYGIFWYYWGNANIWQKREPILQWWHELRNGVK